MRAITLCGLPGSGKTTVGKLLAEKTAGLFIDTDALIEKRYAENTGERLTCRQIARQKGLPFFRECEKMAIASLDVQQANRVIISIGGGAVETAENIRVLKTLGIMIHLKVPLKELFKRINRNGLPSYLDPNDPFGSFEKLMEKRNSLYNSAADITVEADLLSPEEIVEQIMKEINR